MADFNLRTLHDFRPARFLCEKCSALSLSAPFPRHGKGNPKCPACSVEYAPSQRFSRYDVGEYLTSVGCGIKFTNLLQHCIDLAQPTISWSASGSPADPPPLQMLLIALSRAEQFVHFMTFGISEFFIGAFKIIAQRLPVRGIVSNVDEQRLDELTLFKSDVPAGNLEIMPFLRGDRWDEAPHQKLIVIDGLLAFKGSTNLTTQGWRKAGKGRDHVEVVTNVNEVIALNNTLFSPVWATRKEYGATIDMDILPSGRRRSEVERGPAY